MNNLPWFCFYINYTFVLVQKRNSLLTHIQDRAGIRQELEALRMERILRRQYLRHMQTQQFHKSMQMLSGNAKEDDDNREPFEDYSIFVYRQTAPDFKDRVKQLEMKILYPVSRHVSLTAPSPTYLCSNVDKNDLILCCWCVFFFKFCLDSVGWEPSSAVLNVCSLFSVLLICYKI